VGPGRLRKFQIKSEDKLGKLFTNVG